MFLAASWRRPAGGTFNFGHYQRGEAIHAETIEFVIDSHVFSPGPVKGLQEVPGGEEGQGGGGEGGDGGAGKALALQDNR